MIDKRVAIVGGGITGLVTAWQLQRAGVETELFERKGEAGGAIKTRREGDWQPEYGPNTLLLKERIVAQFLDGAGLSGEMVEANSEASNRFIVKNGKLVMLPLSLKSAVTTPLFSAKAKSRLLAEPFITKNRNRDQTVAEFVERRLGSEMLDYAINPFVAGIYANRPEQLSLRHAFPVMDEMEQEYGSLIWGSVAGSKKRKEGKVPRRLISFRKGMQQLPDTLAEGLDHLHLNHDVVSIDKNDDGWKVATQMGSYGPFSDVIVNVPLYKWSRSLIPLTDTEEKKIKDVNYPPLSVMLLGVKKEQVSHPLNGFGFLVPEKENRKILGALFSSTLFEGRAPSDSHLLTVFIGGGRQPDLAETESEELLKVVLEELSDLIGLTGEPSFKDHIYWPSSIPGYHVGYDSILNIFNDLEERNPGLHLAGNFRNGISVPDCIKNGIKLADSIQ
ncbi:MAG: protoporphyrinogen oxidase [Balneolaceae bacterium]|nr:protoporphyrinogen oxidase [Balneolaceae bacterium]MCH8547459.1 protoporphyrinogen oxidase [Balneolaceae bacterium]